MICSMLENYVRHFSFPKSTTQKIGTLREVMDNNTKARNRMPLSELRVIMVEPESMSMMWKSLVQVFTFNTIKKNVIKK